MNDPVPGPRAQAAAPSGLPGFALWNLGFRPFYLLASVFAALSVALWAAQVSGVLPGAYLKGSLWHGHEMVFGYTMAVIAGFLLTAVRNWTGRSTPTGMPLMALAALWVAGRVLVLTPYPEAAAAVNAAFPLALAFAIGIPLVRSRNARNYFFLGLLGAMALFAAGLHLALLGFVALPPRLGVQLGLDVILFVMAVMAGRVVPMFTNNGVPGAEASRRTLVERLALGSVIVLFAADLMQAPVAAIAAVAALAAAAHGARLWLWNSWRTRTVPLVWILHAAYAWIVLHLALRAAAALGWIGDSHAVHALTVGAIGGLTIGMMTRTARGHTGRPLRADRWEIAMFVLVQTAGLTRVFGAMAPAAYLASVQASALLWTAAFGLYAVRYWPVLTRPRLDGGAG